MRIIFYLSILLSLLSLSCEEEFSPKEEFRERNVMFGFVSVNTLSTTQYCSVVLSKTYDVDGFNPYDNKNDPLIAKADVILSGSVKDYKMKEDTIDIMTRYGTYKICYISSDIKTRSNDKFTVTAKLPDGKILTASTIIPNVPDYEYSYGFYNGVTTKINKFLWGDSWIITWRAYGEYLYFPSLVLCYEKVDNKNSYNESEIPLKFVKKDNKLNPVYPGYTWITKLEYSFDAIDSVMSQISAGDADKKNYRIINIQLRNKVFDEHLSKYFSSVKGFLDEYSIRLDESTYSNVSGGIGVFGSVYYYDTEFRVKRQYVESFGYRSL